MRKKRNKKAHHTLRSVMFEQGITYECMARRLGISISAFNDRMRGIVGFSLAQAILISKITGTAIDRLFEELFEDLSADFPATKVPKKERGKVPNKKGET